MTRVKPGDSPETGHVKQQLSDQVTKNDSDHPVNLERACGSSQNVETCCIRVPEFISRLDPGHETTAPKKCLHVFIMLNFIVDPEN
jgi:hypothetical protein